MEVSDETSQSERILDPALHRIRRHDARAGCREVNMYRIEVELSAFKVGQEFQFTREARRAGFLVILIQHGWALAVVNLTERQAVEIRNGLTDIGIHSSIGAV